MIETALLERVIGLVTPAATYDALAKQLRATFPDIHITVCGEDDVPPRLTPAAEGSACRLYYVDANEHCLKLTTDAETATGIVVALIDDD
jgi:phage/plasmid primase-like uncharacterized protein